VTTLGMPHGKIHRGIAAVRMTDQREMGIVGVRLQFPQRFEHEQDIGLALLIDGEPADIGQADPGHEGRIGRKILLDAGDQIAPRRENVGEERILGVPTVADDGDRELPEAVIGLHLVVPAHREIDGDGTLSRVVVEVQCLMPNAP
jgi:hypothetical protein